eukprot:CAMPEP_0116882286 /NCGR_PEP_ID=MMETSP0463-20121206/14488_1 /TAXON_ID=181622 /ORGANISM="Strombidinopsis sp, Strain SopsisLIS2011" /LENGTH=86 /DNA_ID=CAMNT_0004535259 /DNA_START=1 /DNA_END=261 /DNA_ORIENTATION=-
MIFKSILLLFACISAAEVNLDGPKTDVRQIDLINQKGVKLTNEYYYEATELGDMFHNNFKLKVPKDYLQAGSSVSWGVRYIAPYDH